MTLKDREVVREDTDTFSITFATRNGTPINITGYTIWFTVRSTIPATTITDDTDAIISKQAVLTSPALGVATVSVTSDDTNIDVGSYFYDIQYKKPDDSIYSSGAYNYIVKADITRST